jgi:hypothetical protein
MGDFVRRGKVNFPSVGLVEPLWSWFLVGMRISNRGHNIQLINNPGNEGGDSYLTEKERRLVVDKQYFLFLLFRVRLLVFLYFDFSRGHLVFNRDFGADF